MFWAKSSRFQAIHVSTVTKTVAVLNYVNVQMILMIGSQKTLLTKDLVVVHNFAVKTLKVAVKLRNLGGTDGLLLEIIPIHHLFHEFVIFIKNLEEKESQIKNVVVVLKLLLESQTKTFLLKSHD